MLTLRLCSLVNHPSARQLTMPTLFILFRWIIAAAVIAAILPYCVRAQSALSEAGVGNDSGFLIELEAYAKYGGDIDVIDGMTGREYHRANDVVKTVNTNFPKIMGGLHTMLLVLELISKPSDPLQSLRSVQCQGCRAHLCMLLDGHRHVQRNLWQLI